MAARLVFELGWNQSSTRRTATVLTRRHRFCHSVDECRSRPRSFASTSFAVMVAMHRRVRDRISLVGQVRNDVKLRKPSLSYQ